MIENSRTTKKSDSIKQSRKDYYLLMDDHRPFGICTNRDSATGCIKNLASEKKAEELCWNCYRYKDDAGEHFITAQVIKRIKMKYESD